jgi:VWFA-related protein
MIRAAVGIVAGFLIGAASTDAQRPTFSSRLDAVRVDVLVTDGNGLVRGLGPADFEVADNGVVQKVDLAAFEELPLNVMLALDLSQSVSGDRLSHLREAGRGLLSGLEAIDKAALVTFSHRVMLAQALTGDRRLVRDALDAVEPHGLTALVDGTYTAMMLGGADAGRDLLIVFSDGLDTASWLTAANVLDAARRVEVTAYGVSIRGGRKPQFLADLAEVTGGGLIEIESTRDLAPTFAAILQEFRQRYVVSYTPRGVGPDGWHRLEVRIKPSAARKGNVKIKARAGYFGR